MLIGGEENGRCLQRYAIQFFQMFMAQWIERNETQSTKISV